MKLTRILAVPFALVADVVTLGNMGDRSFTQQVFDAEKREQNSRDVELAMRLLAEIHRHGRSGGEMDSNRLNVGDTVADSGMGPGEITGFSERGFPMVNRVTCAWLIRTDGARFDPYGVADKHIAERAEKSDG